MKRRKIYISKPQKNAIYMGMFGIIISAIPLALYYNISLVMFASLMGVMGAMSGLVGSAYLIKQMTKKGINYVLSEPNPHNPLLLVLNPKGKSYFVRSEIIGESFVLDPETGALYEDESEFITLLGDHNLKIVVKEFGATLNPIIVQYYKRLSDLLGKDVVEKLIKGEISLPEATLTVVDNKGRVVKLTAEQKRYLFSILNRTGVFNEDELKKIIEKEKLTDKLKDKVTKRKKKGGD